MAQKRGQAQADRFNEQGQAQVQMTKGRRKGLPTLSTWPRHKYTEMSLTNCHLAPLLLHNVSPPRVFDGERFICTAFADTVTH